MHKPVLTAAFAAVVALTPRLQQNPPVFRGGVDLVTVDVAVIDRDGQPVTGLAATDFSIVAAKRPRRVISAQYVPAPAPRRLVVDAPRIPGPTSNTRSQPARAFLFVIDVEQIAQGGGRQALKNIGGYLDRFRPDDRIGLLSVPTYIPRIELTTNRRLVADALGRIVGASTRNQDILMTVGEAAAIETLDENALNAYLDRINARCGDSIPGLAGVEDDPAVPCILRFQPLAARVMNDERRHTQVLFSMLRELASAMAPLDGPKAIVLVSQGVVNDRRTLDELRAFAQTADRARVTLYALNLDSALTEVGSKYNLITSHHLDHQVLLDGMANLTAASRGDVFAVSGTATNALERIDREMSGYYLLSFERDADDRDGERADIQVSANWPNAVVRARTQFTAGRPVPPDRPAAPIDPRRAVGELMRWPIPVNDLTIDVDTYQTPAVARPDQIRTIIATSLGASGHRIAAAGYEVVTEDGKKIADAFDPEVPAAGHVFTQPLDGGHQLYAAAVEIPPGRYQLKLVAIDDTGRRGSVEHAFEVRVPRTGALRMSDIFVGEISPVAGFLPRPTLPPDALALPVRVDICGDAPATLNGATVTLELSHPDSAPFARSPLTLADTDDRRRRIASATVAIGSLPPGEYVITANLLATNGAELKVSRMFVKR